MPVDTQHPEYVKMLPHWKRMRDCAAGQHAVHAGGESYLPRLTGESNEDYLSRIARTPFFEATWRTIEGLRGMLFRKKPTYAVSTASESMLADVTKSGVGLDAFALKVTEEALTLGRVGVMVDYPSVKVEGMTVAAVERLNLRPHMALYTAESIINWRTAWRNNRTMLTRVVLEESAEIVDPVDRFAFKTEKRWRVLELSEAGQYQVEVYRKNPGGQDELLDGYPIIPQLRGQPLPVIPFQFIGTDDCTPQIDLPPLLGLANVNISHYQTTADLEHGAHKTALPQPWIAGLTPEYGPDGKPLPVTLYMGGGTAWILPTGAEAGMLEYNGQGLGSLEARATAKERMMAVLGARMLEQQKAGVEAAETAGIHRSGEQSALASIGATISDGLRQALEWFDLWAGGDGNAEFKLNDEFFERILTAQEVAELVKGWQSGAFTESEMFEKLKKGGWIRDDKELEDHQAEIETNPPALLAAPEDDAVE